MKSAKMKSARSRLLIACEGRGSRALTNTTSGADWRPAATTMPIVTTVAPLSLFPSKIGKRKPVPQYSAPPLIHT